MSELSAHVETRLREGLAVVAARIGFSAAHHVRDVLDAAKRAMERRCRSDIEAYVADLVSARESADPWIEETVVQETYFFRDLVQLEWVGRAVLAPLAFGRAPGALPLRIWSAGCASGEEAHSLAALVHELGAAGFASVLGTDISAAALRRARLATYGGFALRGAHGERMRPFLEPVGGRYRVRSDIRALSEFRRGNLASPADASDPAPGSVSLIVCRNVLLYFAQDAVANAAARFARALAPEGFLVTAPVDPPLAELPGWTRVPDAVGVYRLSPVGSQVGAGYCAPSLETSPMLRLASPPTADALARPPDVAVEPAPVPVEPLAVGDVSDSELTAAHHHERALTLLEAGDVEGALAAARRVTYLEPQLAMGHFTLAVVALRLGSLEIARRSYREAGRLALVADPDAELPLGDGLRAAEIARSSARQLERLEARR